ncbi:DUF5606 family protein [Geofilum rubicundum]|uniref:Uncharacterized protein n=1 Tax=Geofilum rubicundum JCM 15548 TaxID=1236989 RepID=A0A0E9LUK6_9BACT|nr:DUF5606 domain-containing protein [Geofilum rubicundum]GAO28968.1 hypothetical protein JCM15548_11115 [Geofilum rubicundum JCM 15548]
MVKDILAISGYSGLFKLVSQAKNSIIVESLVDGKRMPAYATSKISALEDISMYKMDGDILLGEVFCEIFDKDLDIDPKSDAKGLKEGFKQVVPDYDDDRVYVSDIKKVFAWYRLLKDKDIINAESVAAYKADLAKNEDEEEA